ncbi:MAG: ABC transporter ATP-binding protein, partial [Saprospiraceae bacterium]
TAALDPKSALLILKLAGQLNKNSGITTILITHNLKDAHQYGNRIIQFQEGKIIRDISGEAKDKLMLQDIYGWFV